MLILMLHGVTHEMSNIGVIKIVLQCLKPTTKDPNTEVKSMIQQNRIKHIVP